MAEKDYYQILGISESASHDEIKKAFHRLAKQYHPDKNKSADAEQRFKDVNEAYQVLSHKDKREKYDQYRKYGGSPFGGWQGAPGGGRQVDFGGFGGADFDFEDLFSSFFGGSTRRSRKKQPQRGSNINASIEIDFETAIHGGRIPFQINRQAECSDCNGTGSKDKKQKTCPQCNGAGVVQDIHGGFAMNKACRTCGGRGKIVDKPCRTCNGRGILNKTQTVEVNIPKGINDGQVIRLANLGNAGEQGAPSGDLLIEVHIRKHHTFRREGKDIYSDVEIGMIDAALGTKIDVLTIDDTVTLTIPPGTQSGTKMRIRDKGVATKTGRGNHYVVVKVLTPTNLSSKQKELLRQFNSEK